MEPIISEPNPSYSTTQIIASIGIVMGMAFGVVAFVAWPVSASLMTVGAGFGFYASRIAHRRPHLRIGRPERRPKATR